LGIIVHNKISLRMEYNETIINSVSEYLIWVKQTNYCIVKADDGTQIPFDQPEIYYRGQSCKCWDLKPSVFRENSCSDENALLKKATLQLWNEISTLRSYLEKDIFFQHYGLSTRLLDVTFNPLIALYMSCYDDNKKSCDGAVYCGFRTEKKDDRIAELTMKYVFENELQTCDYKFQHFTNDENVNVKLFQSPLFILPPINNPRIEAQNGAFIMAPLVKEVKEDGCVLFNRDGLESTDFFDDRRAIIPSEYKADFLHELSVYGIDSGTIYKGVEEKIKAIMMEEKWKEDYLKNRIIITETKL